MNWRNIFRSVTCDNNRESFNQSTKVLLLRSPFSYTRQSPLLILLMCLFVYIVSSEMFKQINAAARRKFGLVDDLWSD